MALLIELIYVCEVEFNINCPNCSHCVCVGMKTMLDTSPDNVGTFTASTIVMQLNASQLWPLLLFQSDSYSAYDKGNRCLPHNNTQGVLCSRFHATRGGLPMVIMGKWSHSADPIVVTMFFVLLQSPKNASATRYQIMRVTMHVMLKIIWSRAAPKDLINWWETGVLCIWNIFTSFYFINYGSVGYLLGEGSNCNSYFDIRITFLYLLYKITVF